MAITTANPASSSPAAKLAAVGPEVEAPQGRLHELLLRYADVSVPLSLRIVPGEDWDAPASSGFWTRIRYWLKRLAWGDLDSDE
jgi:hypothetical protein